MKKIAIISELNMNNFNYGNRLQTFALNNFIKSRYKNVSADSIIFTNSNKRKITNMSLSYLYKKVLSRLKRKSALPKVNYSFNNRINLSNEFLKENVQLSDKKYDFDTLSSSDYNSFIVGSDVVWAQASGVINRVKFLDLNKKNIQKVSYAASFGNNYIPKENIKYIRKYLNDFDYISVREKSAKKILEELKISKNIIHVCDPTLLISGKEWQKLEKPIETLKREKFVFVYLLGKNTDQREKIKKYANDNNLKIVTIPHADGNYSSADDCFGDYQIDDCSPENWLWLTHNSQLIITDSFHGIAFSVNYNKKFIAVKRDSSKNINIRVSDFLDFIDERDKQIDCDNIDNINELKWDYKLINHKIDDFREKSIAFLDNIFRE